MAELTLQQAYSLAVQHHQAGRFGEAEALYRQIQAHHPDNPDVLHMMGVMAHQMGNAPLAVELIRKAISLRPDDANYHGNLGLVLASAGRLNEAIPVLVRAVTLRPNYPDALLNLAMAFLQTGQLDNCITASRQAITHSPGFVAAFNTLGRALQGKGAMEEAIAVYRQAITIQPTYPDSTNNLGVALAKVGRMNEAIECFRQVVAANPTFPDGINNLANVLQEQGDADEAIALFQRALALRPDYADALSNMGNALRDKGQVPEALAACQRALALRPNDPETLNNMGIILRDAGRFDEARDTFMRTLSIRPDFSKARWNMGLQSLMLGDFQNGWADYETRWETDAGLSLNRFTEPKWDGSDLAGRTILLHAEQAFGDTIQFVRYAPLVAQRGGAVIFECHPELKQLLQTMLVPADAIQIIARGEALPSFQVQCPLISLPSVFKTTLETVPAIIPYLQAPTDNAKIWKYRMGRPDGRINVGLVWAGRPIPRNRSIPAETIALLGNAADVRYFSLQKQQGETPVQMPPGLEMTDWIADLHDFTDTAGLIANLDFVITIDTATAHLAGAMGKPVWVLLRFAADWRWMVNRTDSPWYPTMRLFRQPKPGDWDTPVKEAAAALQKLHHFEG